MNARRLLNIITTLLAVSAVVGCGRVPTQPFEGDGSGTGGFGQISQVPTGEIRGRVVNAQSNLGIAGVTVTLMGSAIGSNRSTVTDGAGEFTLTQVPATKQKLSLSKPGYTYLASNGDVIVDVMAGTSVTAPQILMSEGIDLLPNAFVGAFNGVKRPKYLAIDTTRNFIYAASLTKEDPIFGWNTPIERDQIQRFDLNGGLLKSFGTTYNFLINGDKHIFQPEGMTTDQGGNLLLTDPKGFTGPDNPVKRYDLNGKIIAPVQGSFNDVGKPLDIAVLPKRGGFAVVNTLGQILIYNSALKLEKKIAVGPTLKAITADKDDNLYAVDAGQGYVIKKFDLKSATPEQPVFYTGSIGGRGANQYNKPSDIAVDNRNGDIYVVDQGNNRVVRLSSQGTYLSEFGGMGGAADVNRNIAQFNEPTGIVVDNNGYLYVSDHKNDRIMKFAPSPLRQVGQSF
ncbi:carboxypeptidase regulatory-like domain-containing protein [bacterium]|nr:carboxypeptidase regulatory-like domain-containing protein [bacterium]